MDSLSDYERKLLRTETAAYRDLAESWKDIARRWRRAYFITLAGLLFSLFVQIASMINQK